MVYAGFAEVPSNETIELESVELVVCRCRHMLPNAVIGWTVNRKPVMQFPDITSSSVNESDTLVYTLTIPAKLEFNETVVVCVAVFDMFQFESTPPAKLIFHAGLL